MNWWWSVLVRTCLVSLHKDKLVFFLHVIKNAFLILEPGRIDFLKAVKVNYDSIKPDYIFTQVCSKSKYFKYSAAGTYH